MDACINNRSSFYNSTKYIPLTKRFRSIAVSVFLTITLSGCNNNVVAVKVDGAISTFKLTNNGTAEITINDNGFNVFPKSIDEGNKYNVDVVPRSDTSQDHKCDVTGGSNGDGSGTMVNGGVTVFVDCVGI